MELQDIMLTWPQVRDGTLNYLFCSMTSDMLFVSDTFPFVIDCATSVNQRGKIEKYSREGVATPRGAAIDDQGIERTDTYGILRDMVLGKCALTPLGGAVDAMGGYKGKHSFMFDHYQSVTFYSSHH